MILKKTKKIPQMFARTVYRLSLNPGQKAGIVRKIAAYFCNLLRRFIVKFYDPPCRMTIRGKELLMPFSHHLATTITNYPLYDSVLFRVTNHIRSKNGYLRGIDVGANIGDTILICLNDPNDLFLAIEPNPLFHRYLNINIKEFQKNVVAACFLCASTDEVASFNLDQSKGTSQFIKTSEGRQIETMCLDTAIKKFPEFVGCNFLKIDTDGFDFDVLRGSRELLASASPTILFECAVWESHMQSNPNHFKDLIESIYFLSTLGYTQLIMYDNLGNLFSVTNLTQVQPAFLANATLYQLISRRLYFDFLVMKDGAEFVQAEHKFFLETLEDTGWRQVAGDAMTVFSDS